MTHDWARDRDIIRELLLRRLGFGPDAEDGS